MSVKQCVSEIIEGYANGQKLHQNWRKQRQKTILKIRSISNDILDLERSTKKGTVLCSTIGFVSGVMTMAGILGAPFTFGGSLGLTAVGSGIGICSGAADIVHSWINSSQIQSKCNEASTLLEVSQNLTAELIDQLKKLHSVQTKLCIGLNIGHITLKAVGLACKCGEALINLMSRNIPNIEQFSITLFVMFEGSEPTLYVIEYVITGSIENVAAPIAEKAASRIAKKSLRFIGAAAVGIGIIADVVKIVNNAEALDQKKRSELVTRLEKAANEMENEMKRFDELFATPSSAQCPLTSIKKLC